MSEEILLVISVIAPVVVGLTQITKKYLSEKYAPIYSIVLGLLIGLAYSTISEGATVYELLWAGGLSGMVASGFYSTQKIRKK